MNALLFTCPLHASLCWVCLSLFLILQLRMELPLEPINEALMSTQGISVEQCSSLLQRLIELFLQHFQLLLAWGVRQNLAFQTGFLYGSEEH